MYPPPHLTHSDIDRSKSFSARLTCELIMQTPRKFKERSKNTVLGAPHGPTKHWPQAEKKIQKSQKHKKKIIKKSAARAYGVIDNRQKKKVKSLKKT